MSDLISCGPPVASPIAQFSFENLVCEIRIRTIPGAAICERNPAVQGEVVGRQPTSIKDV